MIVLLHTQDSLDKPKNLTLFATKAKEIAKFNLCKVASETEKFPKVYDWPPWFHWGDLTAVGN